MGTGARVPGVGAGPRDSHLLSTREFLGLGLFKSRLNDHLQGPVLLRRMVIHCVLSKLTEK